MQAPAGIAVAAVTLFSVPAPHADAKRAVSSSTRSSIQVFTEASIAEMPWVNSQSRSISSPISSSNNESAAWRPPLFYSALSPQWMHPF